MIFQNVTIEKIIIGDEPVAGDVSKNSIQASLMALSSPGTVTINTVTCVNGGQDVEVAGSAVFGTDKADVLLAAVVGTTTPPAAPPLDAIIFVPTGVNFVIPAVPIGVTGATFVAVWAYSNKVVDMKSFGCSSSSSSSSSSSGLPSSSSSSNTPSSSSSSTSSSSSAF